VANDRRPRWPRPTIRSAIKNVLGLAFLVVGIYVVGGHLRYLGQSRKPSPAAITRTLDQVIAAFPGTRASGVELFDKQTVYRSARVQMIEPAAGSSIQAGQARMEAAGWRRMHVPFGGVVRFCKGDLVAEVTPPGPDGRYALQVNWGNADAVC